MSLRLLLIDDDDRLFELLTAALKPHDVHPLHHMLHQTVQAKHVMVVVKEEARGISSLI